MRRQKTLQIGAVILALTGAIAYAELVSDWRIQRSDQMARYTMDVTHSLSLVNYNKLLADNKKRYGDRAQVNFDLYSGKIEVILDNQTIENHSEPVILNGVQGLFVIGENDAISQRFPFNIEFNSDVANPSRTLALFLKQHFKKAPREWVEFDDKDWTIDRCAPLSRGFGLGFIGKLLDLHEGTACVVTWKGPQPGSMLISVGRADGDPWMRPFSRRICRAIVDDALERFNPDQSDGPRYAGCILADRPAYVSARKSLVVEMYAVGPHNRVARMERQPTIGAPDH